MMHDLATQRWHTASSKMSATLEPNNHLEAPMRSLTLLEVPSTGSESKDTNPTCNLFVVYEDHLRGERAMDLCHQMRGHVSGEVTLKCELWRFDVLDVPLIRTQTATDAAKADVIIFSARATFGVTPSFKDWMEGWLLLKSKREGSALVALLDREDGESSTPGTLHEYLRASAHRFGLDFFSTRYGAHPENGPLAPAIFRQQVSPDFLTPA
jgi:hypothetical protein